jgi:plasmid stabilization system protein ParE
MPNYSLVKSAAQDLRSIIRYTRQQWGDAQTERYAREIAACADRLAIGRPPYRSADDLYPGLRVAKAGSHFVFCLAGDYQPPLIVAILHERMDIVARVSRRLG